MNTPTTRRNIVHRVRDSQHYENETVRRILRFRHTEVRKEIYFSIVKSLSQFAGRHRVLFGIFWKLLSVSHWISMRTRYNEFLFFGRRLDDNVHPFSMNL